MKWQPHDYQKRAVQFMLRQACGALFLDPGLGKSSITLAAFKLLKEQGLVKRMLVLAPLRVCHSVWPAEATKWDDFAGLKIGVLHGPHKDKLLAADNDIDVVNYEGLGWLASRKLERPFWDVLVVDESTRLKHPSTLRFKTLRPLLPKFRRRYILTGSPAPNGLLDLFGQVYVLDLGNALGQYITHYRSNYFVPSGYGGYDWKPRHDAPKRIHDKLQPLALRLAASDYLELPPLINNTIYVDLPDTARSAYNQMEKLLLAAIKDNVVTAANAAAASMKCRQIANGGIYHEDGEKWSEVHQAKSEAVASIVEELGGKPALVAYEFRHDLSRLQSTFIDAPYLGGGITAKEQARIEGGWNNGEVPVLLAQPQSVAHGLNLQGVGAAIVWHSLTWNLELYEQFIRRVWRQGQTERVVVHHIVARDTIDDTILRTVAKKDATQQSLLSALKFDLEQRWK